VIGVRRPTFRHILILGAAMAALAVAGCGRKGPPELPPSAAAAPPAQQQQQQQQQQQSLFGGAQPSEPESQRTAVGGRSGIDSGGGVVAPAGEKKRIPLDVLID